MEEIWKGLIYRGEDFSDKFEVSNTGKLRNAKTKHIYKTLINKYGYEQVCVSIGNKKDKKVIKIHRAVAEMFVQNPKNKPCINHIDGNKTNNFADNLEFVTYQENTDHAIRTGLMDISSENSNFVKLTHEDVSYIRDNYIRYDKEYGSRALANKFNVNESTIISIIKHRTWKNIA